MTPFQLNRIHVGLAVMVLGCLAGVALAGPPETHGHVTGDTAYPFETKDPREKEKPPIELPDSVAPKLELLTESNFSRAARPVAGPATSRKPSRPSTKDRRHR
jgi:hypothetical protein